MLTIKALHVSVAGKAILNGLDLTIQPGEVHAIMGPNGAGKSTLSHILAGKEGYDVISGEILYNGQNLLELDPDERAQQGLFLGFQYPVEVPGVNNAYFLRMALNSQRKVQGLDEIDAAEFMKLSREKMQLLDMDKKFLGREVNVGFSGGEKKRNEVLQMLLFEPKLVILDEMDSGLDIDALQVLAKGVNHLRSTERSFLMITHYQRLLNYVKPDYVHVLAKGRIVRSGDDSLALLLEERGYGWIVEEA